MGYVKAVLTNVLSATTIEVNNQTFDSMVKNLENKFENAELIGYDELVDAIVSELIARDIISF
jgi:ribosomal protein L12E/L44/L45/RPP1/RPP2